MTDIVRNLFYILLIVSCFLLKFTLKLVFSAIYSVSSIIIRLLLDALNMTESSKKRKRGTNTQPNQTVVNRGIINANWQQLLSSNLLMDKKTEKPAKDDSKAHFTGTFRRARKKNNITSNVAENTTETFQTPNGGSKTSTNTDNNNLLAKKERKKNQMTKFLAMDCEMVGIGYEGNDHMLARVSIVNKFGDCVYDKFVKAREEVVDYRTNVSGVRREDLLNAEEFSTVQKEVSELIRGRILVGHSLKNDLSVLFLSHPKKSIRDTSKYKPFRKITKGSTPSLKRLAKEILSVDIQDGEHSSVEDARAAMQLYCTVAKNWEESLSSKRGHMKISED